jgi:cystathionine beta-lyase
MDSPTAEGPGLTELRQRRADSAKWTRYPRDVVPAWVADMDFMPPLAAREALVELAQRGDLGYPAPTTEERYLEAYRDWAERRLGHRPERLRTVAGVLPGLAMTLEALTEPGDVVALPIPAYPRFAPVIEGVGRAVARFPLTRESDRYMIDQEELERFLVDTRAKALIWCNPQNPTGRVFDADEQRAVADACLATGTLVVSDEIHQDLVLGSAHHLPFAALDHEVASRAVVLTSPTKTFNLAGLRVAQIELPRDDATRARVEARLAHSLYHPSLPGMVATTRAYNEAQDWLAEVLATISANVDAIHKALGDEFALTRPEGTYLVWGRVAGLDGLSAARFLLERAGIAVEDGAGFLPDGGEWFRLNVACHETTLATIIERMEHALEDLR